MRAWCGIGWASMLGDLPNRERLEFLHTVARERLVPSFHEVVGGRLWRVADGDVRHVTGPEASAIVRAVAEAPTGEFPYELAEDLADVALPGATDAELELPYAPDGLWHVTDVSALRQTVQSLMNDAADEEPEDQAIWRGYTRELLDCLELCSQHLLAFTSATSRE
jgi:hypothetical protein